MDTARHQPVAVPCDAPRSAHVVKTFAPYLFPRAQRILYDDAKCNRLGWLPCNALRSPQLSGDRLLPIQELTRAVSAAFPKPRDTSNSTNEAQV